METTLRKIWGISYNEIRSDDILIWQFQIKNPFRKDNQWWIGVGEKFLLSALGNGVNRFIIQVGQREIPMAIPSLKELKRKDRANEFEMKQSMFEGSPAMRIYHFRI